MSRLLQIIFRTYKVFLSPAIQLGFGIQCRYEESCSCYMERALKEHGLTKGFALGTKRLLSCSRLNFWSSTHG